VPFCKVLRAASLFDALSATSAVDHPLCEECSDALLELLNQQLAFAEDELKDYNNFIKTFKSDDDFDNVEHLQRELDQVGESMTTCFC